MARKEEAASGEREEAASGEWRAARKKVVVVGAYPDSVVGFRGELIREIARAGCAVMVMAAETTEEVRLGIEGLAGARSGEWRVASGEKMAAEAAGKQVAGGRLQVEVAGDAGKGSVKFRPYWVQRNGMSVGSDWRTLRELRATFVELQPELILAYTIKPIIWGGIAVRRCPKARFFALVTGLGYAFQGGSWKRRLLNQLVVRLYRFSLKRAAGVIFQNSDNRDLFVQHRIVPANKCHVVSGSGINTQHYAPAILPPGPPHFLLIARLLGEKGIREYATAAGIVQQTHPQAIFSLVGPTDPSPDGIPLEEVQAWHDQGAILYHGPTTDVRPYIAACHIYCLPSYHEGMPRSVLEAMAMGRPILTTTASGCKETVEDGVNGWKVPVADANALAERMIWLIQHREQWDAMGMASRKLAETKFDVEKVNAQMLKILGIGGSRELVIAGVE